MPAVGASKNLGIILDPQNLTKWTMTIIYHHGPDNHYHRNLPLMFWGCLDRHLAQRTRRILRRQRMARRTLGDKTQCWTSHFSSDGLLFCISVRFWAPPSSSPPPLIIRLASPSPSPFIIIIIISSSSSSIIKAISAMIADVIIIVVIVGVIIVIVIIIIYHHYHLFGAKRGYKTFFWRSSWKLQNKQAVNDSEWQWMAMNGNDSIEKIWSTLEDLPSLHAGWCKCPKFRRSSCRCQVDTATKIDQFISPFFVFTLNLK